MSYLAILVTVLATYVTLVLLAELLIWRIQPPMEGGVTLTMTTDDGTQVARTLYGFERDGQLYVSSNHWFRRWYHLARAHPDISVERNGESGRYRVVVVDGDEAQAVSRDYTMGFLLRALCGFAPRKYLRLDPAN